MLPGVHHQTTRPGAAHACAAHASVAQRSLCLNPLCKAWIRLSWLSENSTELSAPLARQQHPPSPGAERELSLSRSPRRMALAEMGLDVAAPLGLGRDGDVRLVHMVAPKHADKLEMLDGPASGCQRVAATLLDSNQPLLPQWAALAAPPHLSLFKLHGAMAEPDIHREFLADLDALMAESSGALDAAALVPRESDRMLADRFSMMRLLDEVTSVVSAAVDSGQCPPEETRPPRCCVPRFQDVSHGSFTGVLPESMAYPVVAKPRDSSNHSQLALVFDDAGLQSFARALGTDFRVEQFVSHGARVYKVFVLDEDVYIGERKSLPDAESTEPVALASLAERVDGEYIRDSEGGIGYVQFDSAVLTKGREKQGAGLAPAKRLDEHELDRELVGLLKDSISKRIGTRLFGFDLLVSSSTGQYFVVDGNMFPGYKGVEGANMHIRRHLVQRAAQDAVRDDVRRLSSPEMVRRVCVATVPEWAEADDITVTRMRSHSNHVFHVRNATPNAGKPLSVDAKRACVICRLFGREEFGPKGAFENALVAELSSRKLCAGLISCICATYFSELMHLGRVEEWLPGQTMLDLLRDASTDLPRIAGHIGRALSRLHALLGNEVKEGGAGTVTQMFDSPLKPKVVRRGRRWRINAMIAVNGSLLQSVEIWHDLLRGFHRIAAEIEDLMAELGASMSSKYASQIVFGHFDPTPANIVVMGSGREPTGAELVDFEWAGPNLAVYDFAKFYISMQMRIDQGECNFTEEELHAALHSMVEHYLEAHPSRAEQDAAGVAVDWGSEVSKLCQDIQNYAPVVAAVNMFSNLIHASEENQLRESIPQTTDRWLPSGAFNWLVHASAHIALFYRNKPEA
jgi:hypothetical protein